MMTKQANTRHSDIDGRHIVIHTDGACINNPGPGGWAAILSSWDGDALLGRRASRGGEHHTTNNRMEMLAVINGLKAVKRRDRPIIVMSDSEIVVKGMTEWLPGWKKRGWKSSSGKPVKNQDLWVQLDALAAELEVEFRWLRGHDGDPLNEEADKLANEAAREAAWPPI